MAAQAKTEKKYLITTGIISFLSVLVFVTPAISSDISPNDRGSDPAHILLDGKNSLDRGDYENAVKLLTAASEKLPLLADYALFWRAKANEGKGSADQAISDIRTLRKKFRESPFIKQARVKEIELLRKKNDGSVNGLFDAFIKDYPSELGVKYEYAMHLKNNKETEKAKKLFRELFISASSFSRKVSAELSRSDITAEDLISKGNNLNNALFFDEAEKSFRAALKNADKSRTGKPEELLDQAMKGLAYSVFRQKRYKEASELYRKIKNHYGSARSALRAGDMETLEAELPELSKTPDKRNASVLIAYGVRKRRNGDVDGAIKIFRGMLTQYPSSKEETLWAIGWTQYMSKDYKKAREIFSQLYASYGDPKYLYWKCRCDPSADNAVSRVSFQTSGPQPGNFYAFLSMLKGNLRPPPVSKSSLNITLNSAVSERVDILVGLGFKQEAVAELTYLLKKKNSTRNELIYASAYLKKLGNYRASINSISKVPFSEDLHELYYPRGYWQSVEEASKKNGIDPFLVLSVIREESRFDPEARSVAGAAGLMQLMPQHAQRAKKNLSSPGDLYDSKTNIIVGSDYLKYLLKTYNSIPVALAAYNAGENAVKRWLKNNYGKIDEFIEDIPYTETRNYVKRVMTTYLEYIRANGGADMSETQKSVGNL